MKVKIMYILIPVLVSVSCSNNIRKNDIKNNNPEFIYQTIAAFKSAEHIYEDESKLVFRKLDDCQYIIFYTDIKKTDSSKDILIISSDKTFITNPDYVNLHFKINYIEETVLDPITGENAVINRLKDINRFPSDRFVEAGFDEDIRVDDFIINLKKNIKNDSITEISEMISYPLNTMINKKKYKINDPASFIKEYNLVFNIFYFLFISPIIFFII